MIEICNHIHRVDGEILPNWPLSERVKVLLPHEFCWLRPGEKKDGYDVCPRCHRAVRNFNYDSRRTGRGDLWLIKRSRRTPMNDQLQTHARNTLKEGLAQCSEDEQLIFKRMYSQDNLRIPINEVVDNMDSDRLDWAMDQVKRTLDKKTNRP